MVIEVVYDMCAVDQAMGDDLAARRLAAKAKTEPDAFAALYDLHVDRVYAYAYRMLGDRPRAEDVTAETFTRALKGIRGFQWRGGGFAAWLLRIARNLCYDELRTQSRTTVLDDEDGETLAAGGPSPDEALLGKEEQQQLRSIVNGLPLEQREAVILKYTAGLGNTEIAALTGRSATAVSSLLNRAITNLRERYGGNRA